MYVALLRFKVSVVKNNKKIQNSIVEIGCITGRDLEDKILFTQNKLI